MSRRARSTAAAEKRPRPRNRGRIARIGAAVLIAAIAVACGGSPDAPVSAPKRAELPRAPFIISSPQAGLNVQGSSANDVAGGTVVWISLPSGSLPDAEQVTIRGESLGNPVTATMLDGGLDPVAVAAAPDDTLWFEIIRSGGAVPVTYFGLAPKTARPVVIRTSPPPKKRDVPLNVTVTVVFSEPIAPSSLTATSVQLLNGTDPVQGQLGFDDATNVRATFTPDALLQPGTDYTLSITQDIQNLGGQSLAAAATIQFTTVQTPPPGQIAFVRSLPGPSEQIFLMNTDGSGVSQLTTGPDSHSDPAWSPDGTKLAIRAGNRIAIMNADGSGMVHVTNGPDRHPAWSPDGQRLVFSRYQTVDSAGIAVVNVDGSGFRWLTIPPPDAAPDGYPAWSSDGNRIAFVRQNPDELPTQILIVSPAGFDETSLNPIFPGRCAEAGPAWSRNSQRLLYWSWCAAGTPNTPGLVFVNSDGSGRSYSLSPTTQWGSYPDWSPDNEWIVFASTISMGVWTISIARIDGSAVFPLTEGSDPAWRPRP